MVLIVNLLKSFFTIDFPDFWSENIAHLLHTLSKQGRSQEGGGAWRLGLRPKPRGGFAARTLLGLRPQTPAGAPPQTPMGATAPRPRSERGLGVPFRTGLGPSERGLGPSGYGPAREKAILWSYSIYS